MRQPVVIHWGISSFFGWGIYGLNLALNWAGDSGIDARTSFPLAADQIVIDPLRRVSLRAFEQQSRQFAAQLKEREGRSVAIEAPMLIALGNDFGTSKGPSNTELSGAPSIGVVFFEMPQLSAETLERARAFPLIVCGSTWNEQILRAYGLNNVTTVIQGIDPALFHPAQRQGVLSDRFKVFSGGKTTNPYGCTPQQLRDLRMHTVSMVFQQFALLPWRTVAENVGFGLELAGVPEDELKRRVDEQLELVNLSKWSSRKVQELSGGMQQRVGLARAFATGAPILLMDEPISALDAQTKDEILPFLDRLHRSLKIPILYVTHDRAEIERLARGKR